jgi:hypothetical protein
VADAPQAPVGAVRFRWPILTALAAVVLVAVVVLLVGRRQGPRPGEAPAIAVALVKETRGTVQAVRGGERRVLSRGDTAYLGESLETGRGSSLSMTSYPGDVEVGLGADATLVFDGPVELRVVRGRVGAKVPDSVVHVFISPHGRVLARETRLSLDVRTRGTELEVTEGDARAEGPRGLRQVVPAGAKMFLMAEPTFARD